MKGWKDCSSYSRGDKKRIPTVWEYKLGDLRICVHRYIYCPNDMWLLSCNPFYDKQELETVDLIITSPPYNMRTRIRNGEYTTREQCDHFSRKYKYFDDALSIDEYYHFHNTVLTEMSFLA